MVSFLLLLLLLILLVVIWLRYEFVDIIIGSIPHGNASNLPYKLSVTRSGNQIYYPIQLDLPVNVSFIVEVCLSAAYDRLWLVSKP